MRDLEGLLVAARGLGVLRRKQALARLNAAGIACGALNEMEDLVAHPERRLMSVDTPSDRIEMMAPGGRIVGAASSLAPRVLVRAEQDAALRREFGLCGSR